MRPFERAPRDRFGRSIRDFRPNCFESKLSVLRGDIELGDCGPCHSSNGQNVANESRTRLFRWFTAAWIVFDGGR